MDDKKSLFARRPDYLVCTCMGVMYSELCDAIIDGDDTFHALSERFMVGTGCSSCVQEVLDIIDECKKS